MSSYSSGIPGVLFVCVHNAGRSQIAAALLARHAGDAIRVRSAGTAPAEEISPTVVAAMLEIGIDLTDHTPTGLSDQNLAAADVVITMGCGESCPVYPGKRYLDWNIPDPAGQPLEQVRDIREQIDANVRSLATELLHSRADAEL